ncbi:ATP-binding cassette domain-containing protein [Agromyces bauzanensis]
MNDVLIEAAGLSRSFGGVTAVNGVDLEVRRGEVVGIMGPNGAGKSTLLSLLAGVRRPSSGELTVCGKDMTRAARTDAARLGVGLAHQIPKPFRKLTVRQNIQVASQVVPRRRRADVVRDALELSGMSSKADTLAGQLGLLDLKRLELARVLALDPKVVLLDEVAAGLTGSDLDELIELVAAVHASGRTIVVVEHVQEVLHRLATRVVVLEWGEKLCEGTPQEVSSDPRVVEIYLGQPREASVVQRPERTDAAEPLLEVSGIAARYGPIRVLSDVSFSLYPGEVLAVLGANGAGKTTLARTVQGTIPARSGSVRLAGQDITTLSPHRRLRAGIALVPEGRRLFGSMTVRENLELGLRSARDTSPLDRVYELFPRLREFADREAGNLSGGEQQMVAIGRAMASEPRVILFDELSLGLAPVIVDRMLSAVEQIASWGTAVVLIEQNVHRALELSDRVLLLRRGEVVFSGRPSEFSEDEFQRAYLGIAASAPIDE